MASEEAARWFAEDPNKAWGERFLLAQSPLWMIAVGVVIATGAIRSWGDVGFTVFSIAAALPALVGPLFFTRGRDFSRGAPYWLRLNLWVAIVVFFGTFVGTHYFFDLMGMRYAFPVEWTFEAAFVGKSGQRVPVFMYPLTQAYFVTYFTALGVAYRVLTTKLGLGRPGRVVVVLALSYVLAFAETLFMATGAMADLFSYEKKDAMLALGSIGYASYFVVGLPMARTIDEGERTPTLRVLQGALAACMLIFFLLEAWAKLVGRL